MLRKSCNRSNKTVSRRNFIAGATALAAPWIIPSSALGKSGAVAPSNRINLGVFGLGDRGPAHIRTFLSMKEAQLLAVCDPIVAKAENWQQQIDERYGLLRGDSKYRVCAKYQDFREVLARDDIDAVVVAAPENWHGVMSAMAARAGKDIYCEKALTLTVNEGLAMCKAVRRYGRVLQVGTQQRSSDAFRTACELARNGHIGKIREVRVGVPGGRALPTVPAKDPPPGIDYDLWLGPARYTPYDDQKCTFNWYFMTDYCAGWIQSWGVHHCDIAVWGMPQLAEGRVTVEGSAEFPNDGPADTSITWRTKLTTADGLVLSFCSNRVEGHGQGCRFIGDEGYLHVRRGSIWSEPESLLRTKLRPGDTRLRVSRHHHEDFLQCIRSRRDPVAPVEAGHRATTVTLILDIATRLGRKLTFDWDAHQFVNDDTANRMLGRAIRAPWRI